MKNTFYKILVTLMFVFAVTSCDNSSTSESASSMSPPAWVHGTWTDGTTSFTFTADNLILTSSDNGTINFNSYYHVITEVIETDTTYAIERRIAAQTKDDVFSKISETEISWNATPGFIKQ